MVKLKELTKKDLIDEISELRQKVVELQSEIIRLRQPEHYPVMPNGAPWQPYHYERWQPYYPIEWQPWIPPEAGGTGDSLPNLPMTVCWGF